MGSLGMMQALMGGTNPQTQAVLKEKSMTEEMRKKATLQSGSMNTILGGGYKTPFVPKTILGG